MFGVMLIFAYTMFVCIDTFSSEDTCHLKSKLVPRISSLMCGLFLCVVLGIEIHFIHDYLLLSVIIYCS